MVFRAEIYLFNKIRNIVHLQEPFIEDELEISESVNNINLHGSNSTHSTPSQAQIPQNRTPMHNGNAASETPEHNIPAHELPLEDDDYGLHESALWKKHQRQR